MFVFSLVCLFMYLHLWMLVDLHPWICFLRSNALVFLLAVDATMMVMELECRFPLAS